MSERTLAIIKPDAVKKNAIGDIINRYEKAELRPVAIRLMQLSKATAQGFYAVHKARPFFDSLCTFMSSGPCVVLVLQGDNAIKTNREIMGATDPAKAEHGTIRAAHGANIEFNAVHGSDAPDTAKFEIGISFPKWSWSGRRGLSADRPHAIEARRSRHRPRPKRVSTLPDAAGAHPGRLHSCPPAPLAQPIGDPAVEAETRLWYQASTAFSDGRYSAAIHLYERYLTTYPKSRRAREAHWDLAQAYEQMGEATAAVKEYRTLAGPEGASPETLSSYADRASHRIETLRNQPASQAAARSGHTALYVSFSNLPPMSQVESWVRQLSAQGISAILVDASLESSFTRSPVPTSAVSAGPLPELPRGALFATSRGPVLTDWYSVIVPQAHELGISVYAVLDLFHAPLSEGHPNSRTLLYDPTRRKVHPWTQFDLLSPAVQPVMAQLLSDLTRTGVDGMVFRARAENSFAYEVSDSVLRQFETQFHQPSSDVAQALRDRTAVRQDAAVLAADKTLWRWVGWKARQELEVLALLRKHLQKAVPRLRMVLEIHPGPCRIRVRLGELWRRCRRGASSGIRSPAGRSIPRGVGCSGVRKLIQGMEPRCHTIGEGRTSDASARVGAAPHAG